jgi:hypothetical protein
MPLALVADTIDSVPEALRGEYTERDGKFHLNVEGLEDTAGLKTALAKERASAKANATKASALEAKVARWEALGKTDEEISTLLEKSAAAELEAAKKSGNFDALLADHKKKSDDMLKQHQTKWDGDRAALETELNAARASERNAVIESSLASSLTKVKATPEGLDLLTERLGKRINFDMVDGKRQIQITQADGKTPMAGAGADGTATFDDLVKEAMKTYPSLFEGAGGGSGTDSKGQRRDASGKTLTRAELQALSPAERMKKLTKDGFTVID